VLLYILRFSIINLIEKTMSKIHDKFHILIDEIDNTRLLEHFYSLMKNFNSSEQSISNEVYDSEYADNDFMESDILIEN
jgi:hypothetical protein